MNGSASPTESSSSQTHVPRHEIPARGLVWTPRALLLFRLRLTCPTPPLQGHDHESFTAKGHRPLRPNLRARRVRRGLRGAPGRDPEPRDDPARDHRAREPGASWRAGRRPQDGRRGRDPHPDARRVLPVGRRRSPARRALRRGRLLPPARGHGQAGRVRGAARAHGRGRGPARAGLARRADRHRPRGRLGQRGPARDPPALRRCLGRRGRRRRLRAQALRDPPRRRACRRSGPRHPELLLADHRLQGDAHLLPAGPLLPRSPRRADQERAGPRALALLDEHLPQLGARAPVPDDRPQRRDQHPARQHQLDARARVAAGLGALRRRRREDHPRHPARRLGLGDVRQRARAAHPRRALGAARDDDDDPRGLFRAGRPAG